jgi:hypothetical protein
MNAAERLLVASHLSTLLMRGAVRAVGLGGELLYRRLVRVAL